MNLCTIKPQVSVFQETNHIYSIKRNLLRKNQFKSIQFEIIFSCFQQKV